ncbi:MAG: cytochrome P450 [Gammaproteobacteria bacterium]|nr:cytochrome P450 [Gammaproteobacteria bacterium]MDH5659554.1 cytochrome P450 [Gammaproteobacteria bacterium]
MTSINPKSLNLPAGPEIAFDLNMTEESFPKVAQYIAEFGDFCLIKPVSRSQNTILINDPDAVKYILVKNHENYEKGPGFERVKMLLGNGIIVSDGAYWRKQRRMIQPAFSRQCIDGLAKRIQKANEQWLARWQEKANSGEIIDVTHEMSQLSLEIILRCLFGEDLDKLIEQEGSNPFSILTDDLSRDIQLVIRFRALKILVQQLIDQRRDSKEHYHDFLEAFMDAKDKESGESMTDGEIIDEVMTLIIAGHETSANTLNWAWYELSQNSMEEKILHEEVDKVVSCDIPTFEETGQLHFSRQVIEEALRLYPPVWLFSRTAIADDQVGGYDIPAGTNIFFTPYYLHRHPKYWDQPDSFKPERFTPEAVKQRHKFSFIPFSAGARRCIGDYFSIIEMQIHLGTMARKFKLEFVSENPIELDPQVNLRSKHNIMMKLIKR